MQQPKRGTPDFILLTLTVLLTGFGVLMVFSASSASASLKYDDALYFTKRQLLFAAAGLTAMLVLMNVPFQKWKKWFVPCFFLVVIMLVFVLFREPIKGARSWIQVGPFGVQPSEFAKLGVILYLAALIHRKGEKIRDFKTGLVPVMIIVGFTAGLILLQPDYGTAMVLVLTAAITIVAGGANLKHLFVLGTTFAVSIALTVWAYTMMTGEEGWGHRMDRFTAYLNPWADPTDTGYHIIQSLYAFGHGGLTGAGFGQGIQKLHYLPEAHNDFIFPIIGEEFGFIGSTLFLLCYLALIWRILLAGLRSTDTFGTLVAAGGAGMIAVQAMINIGGVTNTIPLTGVTLPLISYGGSSLLSTLAAIGIVLSISRENNRIKQT